jgi:hypothetical protein
MPHAASETVRSPDQHDVEFSAVGSGHHLFKSWSLLLRAADPAQAVTPAKRKAQGKVVAMLRDTKKKTS